MILFREIELEMITLYQLVPRKMEEGFGIF